MPTESAHAPAGEPLRISFISEPQSDPVPRRDKVADNRRWKFIKTRPLAVQLVYLKSRSAMETMEPGLRLQRMRSVELQIARWLRTVPSDSWARAMIEQGLQLPLTPADSSRKHDARMKLSREKTRVGADGEPSRRWTPGIAVALEDFLDSLDVIAAARHEYPPSPSGAVIQRLAITRGHEVGGISKQWKR